MLDTEEETAQKTSRETTLNDSFLQATLGENLRVGRVGARSQVHVGPQVRGKVTVGLCHRVVRRFGCGGKKWKQKWKKIPKKKQN